MCLAPLPGWSLRRDCPQTAIAFPSVRLCRAVGGLVVGRKRAEILAIQPRGSGLELRKTFVDATGGDFCDDAAVAVHRDGCKEDLFVEDGRSQVVAGCGTVRLRELGSVNAIKA